MAPKKAPSKPPTSLSLPYSLASLPSSQHRAGLAGLVLLARYLERVQGRNGLFCCKDLSETGVTLELDAQGLKEAFDVLYAASFEEVAEPKQRKKDNRIVEPIRREEKQEQDKKGQIKTKTVYIYPSVVPQGGPLAEWDLSEPKAWIKLWRNFIWQIPRGNPQSRGPYEDRASGVSSEDHQDVWQMLCKQPEPSVKLASTCYLGAQEKTSEDVLFQDQGRNQFLLHFWPLTLSIYVPQEVNPKDGKRTFIGFAVAVPDVSDLELFCDIYPALCKERWTDSEMNGYRPKASIVDIAPESALDTMTQLHKHLTHQEGNLNTKSCVFGFDVFHMNKEGNNVRLLSMGRIEPDDAILRSYERIKNFFRDPFFRKQRLLNLLANAGNASVPWYQGFDHLLATLPHKTQGFGSRDFRRDAYATFALENKNMDQDKESKYSALIYRMVQTYVLRKVEQKCGLRWDKVQDEDPKDSNRRLYEETKEKIARDAFLAVRSRTGRDFLDYFAGTIASVQQRIKSEDFIEFTRWLRSNPDDVRTLTLLALSAVGLTQKEYVHAQEEPVCIGDDLRRS